MNKEIMLKGSEKKKYDIVLLEKPVDDALDFGEIKALWEKIKGETKFDKKERVDAVPVSFEGNNSVAMGFIRLGVADTNIPIEKNVQKILNDMSKENANGIYQFGNISVFLSRDLTSDGDSQAYIRTCEETKDTCSNSDDDAEYSIVPAKILPGYIWTHFSDGSGDLATPDGKTVCQYDLITHEYKIPIDKNPGWDIIPDGFLLEKFKTFAEDKISRLV